MSVFIRPLAIGNPQDVNAPKKFYARAMSEKPFTLRDLAKEISMAATVNQVDVFAVLESLILLVPMKLADGKIVHLGDFGTFRLSISSTGYDTPEEVSANSVKAVRLLFRPGKAVSRELDQVEFKLYSLPTWASANPPAAPGPEPEPEPEP